MKTSGGQKSDFALVELIQGVNRCSEKETADGKCWMVTPVRLPDLDIFIPKLQLVRTLGTILFLFVLGFNVIPDRMGSYSVLLWSVRISAAAGCYHEHF